MLQEWRLIYRTPRGKMLLAGFILLPLAQLTMIMSFFEGNSAYKSYFLLFILTSYGAIPVLGYMQFGMGWQGKNLAMYFSRPITVKNLLWSKYLLGIWVAISSTVIPFICFCFIGSLFFIGASLAAFLFVAGFNTVLICTAYKKFNRTIDRQTSGLMANWQGIGTEQHILGLIYMIPVIIIVGLLAYLNIDEWYCVAALALLGMAMLIIAFKHVASTNSEKNKYFLINTFA